MASPARQDWQVKFALARSSKHILTSLAESEKKMLDAKVAAYQPRSINTPKISGAMAKPTSSPEYTVP